MTRSLPTILVHGAGPFMVGRRRALGCSGAHVVIDPFCIAL